VNAYKAFIGELRHLVKEGATIARTPLTDLDPRFRKWRVQVESLVQHIEQEGYSLPCPVHSQSRVYLAKFELEIHDTLNELRTLIDRYEKFGEPRRRERVGGKAVLTNGKETLSWLWHNVSRVAWGLWLASIAAAFGAGFYAGRTDFIVKVLELWSGQ